MSPRTGPLAGFGVTDGYVLYPNDADGNAIRASLAPLLAKGGHTIVDPGPYETGTSDCSTQIAMFK